MCPSKRTCVRIGCHVQKKVMFAQGQGDKCEGMGHIHDRFVPMEKQQPAVRMELEVTTSVFHLVQLFSTTVLRAAYGPQALLVRPSAVNKTFIIYNISMVSFELSHYHRWITSGPVLNAIC